MLNKPLVTIAIPFYNREDYLGYAIQSVINQTYSNWELILIDDGSTDSSLQIARSFAESDKRIKVVADGKNKRLAARLNETILIAEGEYYARMDDDDIMAIYRIEKQVDYLEKHKEIDVVGSSVMIIDDRNEIIRSCDMSDVIDGFIHPSVMGRSVWYKRNLYDPTCKRCQDVDLWLRTGSNSQFYNLKEPLLFYREFGVQSLEKNLSSHSAYRHLIKKYKIYGKSLSWYLKCLIVSYIRSLTYFLFSAFGKLDVLVKSRKRKQLPVELWLKREDLINSINN